MGFMITLRSPPRAADGRGRPRAPASLPASWVGAPPRVFFSVVQGMRVGWGGTKRFQIFPPLHFAKFADGWKKPPPPGGWFVRVHPPPSFSNKPPPKTHPPAPPPPPPGGGVSPPPRGGRARAGHPAPPPPRAAGVGGAASPPFSFCGEGGGGPGDAVTNVPISSSVP